MPKISNKNNKKPLFQRDVPTITRPIQGRLENYPYDVELYRKLKKESELQQDRRQFLLKSGPALTVHGTTARYKLARRRYDGRPYRHPILARIAFDNPAHIPICKRRKNRRSSLFALSARLSRRGLGSGAKKLFRMSRVMSRLGSLPKKRNQFSDVRC